jgi:adenosylhomocysteine nucleosidase
VSVASTDRRFVVAVSGLGVEARIAAGDGVTSLAGGGDRDRIVDALEREVAQGAVAIISFGIAGGLNADTLPGICVVADAVVTSAARWPVDASWAAALEQRLPGAVRGGVVGADAIVCSPTGKRALGEALGAIAVDTESHLVASFASARGIPFAVLRAIADPVASELAPAAARGMRSDGSVDYGAVLASLLRQPGQLLSLIRNAIDARSAFRALLRGRRSLGPGLGYPDL